DRAYEANLNVGSADGWNFARAYMNFDVAQLQGKVIESAQFKAYQYNANSCSPELFTVHRVTQAWWGHTMTGPPGASLGQGQGSIAMGCDQAWRAFDVAEAVRTWSAQPWTAFGLGLRAESEPNGATLRQFLSWNYCACASAIPQIEILWRETYDPYGAVDLAEAGVGGVRVAGWAIDPDTTAPIPVHVYVGAAGTAVTADGYRPDVGAAFGLGDYHGYDAFIPATSGTHQVCLYAINVAGAGSNQQIGCRTLTISGEPFGAIDEVTGVANGVKVRGWAIDPDTTAPIQLQVSVSGAVTTIAADKDRPDIGAAYPRYGSLHGYDSTIPVAGAGLKTVCITALNAAGQGGNPSLGCRTVNVAMAPSAPNNVTAESWSEGLSVTWSLPDFDGASPIASYTAIAHHA
ncbi:MAG: DNRLRE domain-containing protein, partial [Acidimicrobiales bacterium]